MRADTSKKMAFACPIVSAVFLVTTIRLTAGQGSAPSFSLATRIHTLAGAVRPGVQLAATLQGAVRPVLRDNRQSTEGQDQDLLLPPPAFFPSAASGTFGPVWFGLGSVFSFLSRPAIPASVGYGPSSAPATFGQPRDAKPPRIRPVLPPPATIRENSCPAGGSCWIGGTTGNWSSQANWSNGVPTSSLNAFIDNGNPQASSVSLDTSGTANNLTLDSGDSLTVLDGFSLVISGTTITNSNKAGGLDLDASESHVILIIDNSNVTLTGGGALLMSNNAQNYIYGLSPSNVLTNQETIEGAGDIGDDSMAFNNAGTVNANQSSGLTINTSNGFTNSSMVEATNGATLTVANDAAGTTNKGTMQATTGGTLVLTGNAINNAGGTIQALNSATPSTVMLENGAAITGGTLTTTGNGTIVVQGGQSATLNNLTMSGTFLNGGSTTLNGVSISGSHTGFDLSSTTLEGTINLTGNLMLNSAGNFTSLVIGSANVTLAGAGTLTMSNFPASNVIYGSAAANILTNQATIQGSGTIGYDPFTGMNQLALVNSGMINGNQSALTIDTSNGFTNSSTVEATNGATLTVVNDAVGTTNKGTMQAAVGGTLVLNGNTINNAGGTIRASTASTVLLQNGVTITGGTLTTTGNGNVVVTSGQSAVLSGITMSGNYTVSDGASTILNGTVNVTGSITLNSTGDITQLIVGSSNVTLAGGSTVMMSNNGLNYIQGSAAANTLTNRGTILGSGDIANDQMALANAGTINANQAIGLTINTSNGFTNSGLMEVTNGATLDVVNDAVGTTNSGTMQAAGGSLVLIGNAINNAGGTIQALNSATPSTVSLQSGVAITGGTLTTTGNGTIVVPGGQSATLNGVTIAGNYSVSDGASTTLNGTINFTGGGTISLNGATQNTALIIGNSNATIGSGGTVTMSNFLTETGSGQILTNAIYGSAPADTLTNKGTIQGAGYIGYDPYVGTMGQAQMALVNSGTINANQSAGLAIDTSNGFTNSGTVEATNPAGQLSIYDATAIINSGTIEAAPGTTLFLEAPTVTNTVGTISANNAVLYVSGAINGGNLTLTGEATLILRSGLGFLGSATIQGATVTNNAAGTIEAYGPNNTLGGTLINPAGGQIRVDDVSSLTLAPGAGSNLAGTISIVGTFSTLTINGSNITLPGSVISSGSLIIGGSNLILGPTATLTMSMGTANVYGSAAANTLTNQGTIVGTGSLGLAMAQAQMALVNSGTISDNEPNGSLIIGTSNGFVNSGTAEATNGATLTVMNDATGTTNTGTMEAAAAAGPNESTLVLSGNSVNNTRGVIEALASSLSYSEVELQNGVIITGGTLTTTGNGEIDVLSNQSATLNSLALSGRTHVFDGGSLTLEGSIQNTGALSLFSNGDATSSLISGKVTLTGGGTISLSPSSGNSIVVSGATGTDTLINVDNTIQGSGTIGNGMALNNQGTIDACCELMGTAPPLTLQVSNGVTDTGTLEATGGGTLVLNGGIYTNTGGTILAGTGSVVQLENGVHLVGGTLASAGTGLIEVLNSATLQGLTNTGTYVVPDGNITTLVGTITNTGSLQLNSSGLLTQLLISGNVTLNGSGTVTLSNNANNLIRGASTGNEVLANNGTIQGSGNIGDGFMGLVNKGTILANQSTPLYINPSNAGFNNKGTVAVSAGSTLDVTGPAGSFLNFSSGTGTLTGGSYNVSGTLQFDDANVTTNAASITLNGNGWQIIDQLSANALAHFATNAAGGTFALTGGANFTTAGNFTNNGTLNVGSGTTFDVNGNLTNFSGATLTGGTYVVGGTLGFNGANVVTDAANITLNGTGSQIVDQSSANALANLTTVAAGGTFTVANGRTFLSTLNFTNNGSLAAVNGGDFITLGSLTNAGLVTVGNGSALLAGGLGNTGTLSLSGSAIVQGTTGTQTLASSGWIEGSGNVGNATMGIVNTGTILANQSTALVINPSSAGFNNKGDLLVNAGSTLDIMGPANSFLNFNSSTGTLTGGQYTALGTLEFDNANMVTNAADITLFGPSSQIVNQSSANALANFATNAAGGILTLADGRNFTTAGNFTNNGALVVDAGSQFTVNGSLSNFSGTQLTGGTYRLYGGTLQFDGASIVTNAANITLSGPTSRIIDGSGHNALANFATNLAGASFVVQGGQDLTTAAISFINGGYLGVGTGSTFTLGVGSYTQNSGGVLDIAIAGTKSGADYGVLAAVGSATLDGTLEISLTGGASLLTVGEKFDIVTGSAIACGWGVVGLGIDSSEHFQVDCNSKDVVLEVDSGTAWGWSGARAASPNAPTPEPASLVLLGTALLGLAGMKMVRREG